MATAYPSIAQCRELLGAAAESMTDEQIAKMSDAYREFARAVVGICVGRAAEHRQASAVAESATHPAEVRS